MLAMKVFDIRHRDESNNMVYLHRYKEHDIMGLGY